MKKKSNASVFICLILFIALVVVGAYAAKSIKDLQTANEQVQQVTATLQSNQHAAYVATQDIKAGDQLKVGENIVEQNFLSGLSDALYYSSSSNIAPVENASGEAISDTVVVASSDIIAGTPVMLSMITQGDFSKDERETEVDVASLMTTQEQGDYVDVRIAFPDGSDYVVLSKKKVVSLSLENQIFTTYTSEADIERLTCATLDACLKAGTRIYTTKYVAGGLQDKAYNNYPVRQSTLDLISNINNNPNLNMDDILDQARRALNMQNRQNLLERLGYGKDADETALYNTEEYNQNVASKLDDTKSRALTEIQKKLEEAQNADDIQASDLNGSTEEATANTTSVQ